MMVVERLFPEAVATAEKTPRYLVVDGESPHAVQAPDHGVAPHRMRGQQHFGVGMIRAEDLSGRFEFFAQFGEVVDFAVEDDGALAVGAPHRLRPALQVEDAQTPVPEMDTVALPESLIIRTAVGQTARHAQQVIPRARSDKSRNAAHGCSPPQPPARSKLRVERTR